LTYGVLQSLKFAAFKTGAWKGYQEAWAKFLLPRVIDPCMNSEELAMSYLRLGNLPEAFQWFNRQVDESCFRAGNRSAARPFSLGTTALAYITRDASELDYE
jgi:hypothetical protein